MYIVDWFCLKYFGTSIALSKVPPSFAGMGWNRAVRFHPSCVGAPFHGKNVQVFQDAASLFFAARRAACRGMRPAVASVSPDSATIRARERL